MLDIEISKRKGIDVIDSRLLHKKLDVKSYHADWIRRRIDNYQFDAGKDYFVIDSEKSELKRGPKPRTYFITLDMAKELCMLENNGIGKATRRYFIKAEKQLRKHEAVRLASVETRKTLTDRIDDSGENDRMHGHGYSTYTRMVYELSGLTGEYKKWKTFAEPAPFRECMAPEELKRVEIVESLIKPLLEMDKQYSEIKETLKPLFEVKKLEG